MSRVNQLPADPALDADWTGICRNIVEEQKKLFDEFDTIEARDEYEGVGEGGDHTLVLDRKCEDVVFAELEKLGAAEVDLLTLKSAGLVSQLARNVKVIKSGALTQAVKLTGIGATAGAKAAIEAAGGSLA